MNGKQFEDNVVLYNDDVVLYNDFVSQWSAGTLTEEHPVMIMIDYWARVVDIKYNCGSQSQDLKSEAVFSIATQSNYAGLHSLRNYVLRVLISKVSIVKAPLVRVPRKAKKGGDSGVEVRVTHQYVMIDDNKENGTPIIELPDERSDTPDKVLRRIAFDTELIEKIASLPELQRVIVDIVIEHEEKLGERRIAEEASKRLGRKVTRHQVQVALAQLAAVVGASLW